MNLINAMRNTYFLPIWLTLVASIASAHFFQPFTSLALVLILLIIMFQTALSVHAKLQARTNPLQRFGDMQPAEAASSSLHNYLSYAAIIPALLAGYSFIAASIVLVITISIYLPQAWRLSQGIFRAHDNQEHTKQHYLSLSPKVAVYVAGNEAAAYQLNQWLPVLEKLRVPVVVISRHIGFLKGVSPSSIEMYYARTHAEVEWLLSNGPQTVLYPANPAQNAQALRQYQLNHFFINHGESDKAVNQSKLLMAYDKLLVGGPLAERRLHETGLPIRPGQIAYVGRPQAEMLLEVHTGPIKQVHNILYAPTWEGFGENVNYSSVCELGIKLLAELAQQGTFSITFKPHPFTGRVKKDVAKALEEMSQICKQHNIPILGKEDSLHNAMNWSDVLITDVSSVLNEYLVTNKPIIFCNSRSDDMETLSREFPSTAAAYCLNAGDSVLSLLDVISQGDSKRIARESVRRDSLGDPEVSAMERFENEIYRSIGA